MTKFTPYPGTPSYATIREHGTFVEDWERMNAMNLVFVPNGLTPEIARALVPPRLPHVLHAARTCCGDSRRTLVGEPRFLRRVSDLRARRRARLADGAASARRARERADGRAGPGVRRRGEHRGRRRGHPAVRPDGGRGGRRLGGRHGGARGGRRRRGAAARGRIAGKGAALVTGLRAPGGRGRRRARVTLDADGQHLPDQIPVLLAAADAAPERHRRRRAAQGGLRRSSAPRASGTGSRTG